MSDVLLLGEKSLLSHYYYDFLLVAFPVRELDQYDCSFVSASQTCAPPSLKTVLEASIDRRTPVLVAGLAPRRKRSNGAALQPL